MPAMTAAGRSRRSLHAAAEVIARREAQCRAAIVVREVVARGEVRREVPAAAGLQHCVAVAVVEVHELETAVQLELGKHATAHADAQTETGVAATAIHL